MASVTQAVVLLFCASLGFFGLVESTIPKASLPWSVWQIFWGVTKISVTCLICQAMIYLLQQWLESESVCLVETYKRPGWL